MGSKGHQRNLVFMGERFQTLQRIKIVLMLGLMLAFVHASAAAGMAQAAEPDHGPSSDAFSLATLDGLLDVRESGGSAGNGDDAQESGKFFRFAPTDVPANASS